MLGLRGVARTFVLAEPAHLLTGFGKASDGLAVQLGETRQSRGGRGSELPTVLTTGDTCGLAFGSSSARHASAQTTDVLAHSSIRSVIETSLCSSMGKRPAFVGKSWST